MTTARGRSRSRSRSPSSSSRSSSSGSSSSEEGELPRDYDFGPRYDPVAFAALQPAEQNQFINQQRQCNRRNMLLLERRRGHLISDAHRALKRQREIMWRDMDAFKASLAVPVRERLPKQQQPKPRPKKREPAPQRKRARSPSPKGREPHRPRSPPRNRLRRFSPERRGAPDDFDRQQALYMRGLPRVQRQSPPRNEPVDDPEDRPLNISLTGPSLRARMTENPGDRRIVVQHGAPTQAAARDEPIDNPACNMDDDVPNYSGEDCDV